MSIESGIANTREELLVEVMGMFREGSKTKGKEQIRRAHKGKL
jgi:hypothetical protein